MNAVHSQADLFGGRTTSAPLLKEPVPVKAVVLLDPARRAAVRVEFENGERHWVPRSLIRFDGLGPQELQIERWKAKELGL